MADDQTVWKALVTVEGEGGNIFKCDVIEHEGRKWLVPYWLHSRDEEWSMPARIVCLDQMKHDWHPGSALGDATISGLLPKAFFGPDAPASPTIGFLVKEKPDLKRIVRRRLN